MGNDQSSQLLCCPACFAGNIIERVTLEPSTQLPIYANHFLLELPQISCLFRFCTLQSDRRMQVLYESRGLKISHTWLSFQIFKKRGNYLTFWTIEICDKVYCEIIAN